MKKLNSNGFSHIEILLVVLILAIVGFGAYFVKSKNDDKNAKATVVTTTTTPATTPAESDTMPSADTTKYLTIAQWGVKGKDSGVYKLNYAITTEGAFDYAKFNATELAAQGGSCATDSGPGGTISRSKTNTEGSTKIGDYYYSYAFGNGTCGGDYSVQEAVRNEVRDVWSSLVTE